MFNPHRQWCTQAATVGQHKQLSLFSSGNTNDVIVELAEICTTILTFPWQPAGFQLGLSSRPQTWLWKHSDRAGIPDALWLHNLLLTFIPTDCLSGSQKKIHCFCVKVSCPWCWLESSGWIKRQAVFEWTGPWYLVRAVHLITSAAAAKQSKDTLKYYLTANKPCRRSCLDSVFWRLQERVTFPRSLLFPPLIVVMGDRGESHSPTRLFKD